MKRISNQNSAGFSLLELMIALFIIGLLAAFIIPSFRNAAKAGDGKRVLSQISQLIEERKTAAVRLNQSAINAGDRPDQPVILNFAAIATTAPLKTDGKDEDRDGIEDNSGARITRWGNVPPTGKKGWIYGYEGLPLKMPDKWQIVASADDLGAIPQIPNSQLTVQLRFNAQGRPSAPAVAATPAGRDESPFFAVYARDTAAGNIIVAVAVHGSGLVEEWTFDYEAGEWRGRGGRRI